MSATDRRPAAKVPRGDLPRQLRIDATEMAGCGAGNEAEHMRQAADEIGRLRNIIAQTLAAMEALHPNSGGDMDCGDFARLWNSTTAMLAREVEG